MNHRPRKRFGQHFLHDPGVLRRIVTALDPGPGERLVEIGPGLGALTREVLPLAGRVEVVELDRDVIPHLRESCAGLGELVVHQADALKFDFAALAGDGPPLRVFGNLPYNVSTPLIFHLIGQAHRIRDCLFMLQKEVVDRLAAGPGEDAYGRLGIMVQFHCRVEPLFRVGPGAFTPPPKVDSAVVRLTPHAVPPVAVNDPRRLEQVVAQAFTRRRKTLRNALKGLVEPAAIEALGIDTGLRPENLSLEQYARISNTLD
ncbi:16S rRNA (adenine(1518)-N(6)/adenine(1519)-N(6))-dimethyltransferase RsmA [Thioalbus denitrificans]|uniref:Ribosomal RNA small subunit methyltransferase A n=1 Tax=Thioalbus denitrificans TaxID=547122 RepID=A0A369CG56_9GAMM|nr:16S rRNA (adenine(1518)-N(6)/adenine(1519)-N(6))-dimethyltransferase RsmA [Thioalbus denitrificans]RCX33052.1 dimethyladenosine transferase [Thioalbus denitrificans]